MKKYLDLVRTVLNHGTETMDRTETGTISLFGHQTEYDLRSGFPLLTTKKILFNSVVRELLWLLSGSTNINELKKHTSIWNAWADQDGEIGPMYGYQWRNWGGDQIKQVIDQIKTNPTSRRLIVSAWNVADIPKMALPPCHSFFQFYVGLVDNKPFWLDCKLYQRSADLALGVPFNIASYALLLTIIAQECDLTPRWLIHSFGDLHIYKNHVDGLKEQLLRKPLSSPQVTIEKKPFEQIQFEDVKLFGYIHHPFIKFDVSV